jgi:nicotinamide riboside kinase
MRIAIAGASGTGKTTLARAISEKYNIPLNPVGARSVALAMGFDNPYDVDKAGRRVEFQRSLFEAKRDWELAHDDFVTDRSYLDNLTYCVLHMAEHLEERAIETFTDAMARYDLVLMLHRETFQSLDDGIRKTNVVYHQLYEHVLWSFMMSPWNKVCIRSPGIGDIKDREKSAFGYIEEVRAR